LPPRQAAKRSASLISPPWYTSGKYGIRKKSDQAKTAIR